MRGAIKDFDVNILFGISPQGNISMNYKSQFADVKLWASDIKYCDYMVPQIYFGFENENMPFEKALREWEDITSDEMKLIIGLAGYKVGEIDKWAGTGKDEWVVNDDIIERQVKMVVDSSANGYAIYN
jgi:uncharacterized lipoprotein YddW (UPF0748 family)